MNKKEIIELIKQKKECIQSADIENNIKEKQLEKLNTLLRLISNPYHNFFSEIDIEIAYQILEDIGIDKKNLATSYQEVVKEEIGKKYILIDTDIRDNKEEER